MANILSVKVTPVSTTQSSCLSTSQLLARTRGEQVLDFMMNCKKEGINSIASANLSHHPIKHPYEEIPDFSLQDPLIGLSKFGWIPS